MKTKINNTMREEFQRVKDKLKIQISETKYEYADDLIEFESILTRRQFRDCALEEINYFSK